jgi:DNA-binding response OmpR family regulator/DNA-binding CsgD family transcriptional regulator
VRHGNHFQAFETKKKSTSITNGDFSRFNMDKPVVLIVDDEDANLQLLGNILSHLNIDIALASSGPEAFKLMETLIPDLIILDIIMPLMSGFEVCREISTKKDLNEVPIILISAMSESEDIIKGFAMGARDYITKPFIKEELLARVETQLKIQIKENQLKKMNISLEERIKERTQELIDTNAKLSRYNIALQVLIEKRDEDRKVLEQKVISNTSELVIPSIDRLKKTNLTSSQRKLLLVCEENIRKITSAFIKGIENNGKSRGLTHREITVANLISQGKSSQEISSILNSSESTINFHRNNIRKKLGIKNKPVNLHLFLKSLEG